MTKADIVEDIAQKTGLTKKEVGETVDLFLEQVSDLLSQGRHLEIRGFGTFKVKERKERMARNPRTGMPCRCLRAACRSSRSRRCSRTRWLISLEPAGARCGSRELEPAFPPCAGRPVACFPVR